jgi:hypothetical protein
MCPLGPLRDPEVARGAMYGIFDLAAKIRLLATIQSMSSKVTQRGLYVTETNWPIAGTAPYAPTSEKECVSMERYCTYMIDYFKIASESGFVSRIYWHQLVAPGYGLIDNRYGKMRKTRAFFALKDLIRRNRSAEQLQMCAARTSI